MIRMLEILNWNLMDTNKSLVETVVNVQKKNWFDKKKF